MSVTFAAAMTNLCRDEVTAVLKDKIEAVFGGSFNTNGLGAVLTCGVTGIKAGLSHSPVSKVRGSNQQYSRNCFGNSCKQHFLQAVQQ
jgi:hypothetical protein